MLFFLMLLQKKSLYSPTKIWFVPPSPFTPLLGVQKVSPPLEPYWRYYIFEAFFPSYGKKSPPMSVFSTYHPIAHM